MFSSTFDTLYTNLLLSYELFYYFMFSSTICFYTSWLYPFFILYIVLFATIMMQLNFFLLLSHIRKTLFVSIYCDGISYVILYTLLCSRRTLVSLLFTSCNHYCSRVLNHHRPHISCSWPHTISIISKSVGMTKMSAECCQPKLSRAPPSLTPQAPVQLRLRHLTAMHLFQGRWSPLFSPVWLLTSPPSVSVVEITFWDTPFLVNASFVLLILFNVRNYDCWRDLKAHTNQPPRLQRLQILLMMQITSFKKVNASMEKIIFNGICWYL